MVANEHGPRRTGTFLGDMPSILQFIWLGLSVVFTLTAFASIVEPFLVWADFFSRIIQVYKSTLRDPLAQLVNAFWPSGWPRIPKVLFDLLIVWSAFFTALRLFWAREGKWLRNSRQRISWPLAFVLGPFVVSYYSIQFGALFNQEEGSVAEELFSHETGEEELSWEGLEAVRKRREAVEGARVDFRTTLRNLGAYYILLACAFILLLFINYQIKKAERTPPLTFGMSSLSDLAANVTEL